jgi:hypothetical protein
MDTTGAGGCGCLASYGGEGIVNLVSSLVSGLGGVETGYPPLAALPPARVAGARRVVLLVVDGLGHDLLAAGPPGGTLRRGLLGPITSVFPPTTATAIPTFLTGLAPSRHGLVGWHTYFRELGTVATVLPYTTRPGRFPLARSGVGADTLFGLTPVFARLPVASTAVLPRGLADSEVSRALAGPAVRLPFRSLGGLLRQVLGQVRQGGGGRRFVYAYWPEIDRLAHRHGSRSPQVAAELARLDAGVKGLLAGLAGTDTLLVVTADHGFVDVPPGGRLWLEDHPDLAAGLVLPLCGEPRTAYCYVHPHRARAFGREVEAALGAAAWARPSEALLEEGWLGPGPCHPGLADRLGHWTVLMNEGHALSDRLLGEEPHPMVGFHGGVSAAEMRVPLAVWEC